jgi:hypothetical protein
MVGGRRPVDREAFDLPRRHRSGRAISLPDCIRPVNLLGALLVSRLLLAQLIAHDTLIGPIGRPGLRCWHALLAAMFAALILHTFQIVLFGHRDRTLFALAGSFEPSRR